MDGSDPRIKGRDGMTQRHKQSYVSTLGDEVSSDILLANNDTKPSALLNRQRC